jgi:hypothetical protein
MSVFTLTLETRGVCAWLVDNPHLVVRRNLMVYLYIYHRIMVDMTAFSEVLLLHK